jgi:hypothetical protein
MGTSSTPTNQERKTRPGRLDIKRKSICDVHALQYVQPARSRQGSGECELVIGFDFGTSATKVIVQAPDLQGSPGFAVDFGEFSHPSHPCLLPSRVWHTPEGGFALESLPESRVIGDLKLRLFAKQGQWPGDQNESPSQIDALTEATAFLALGLRYTRQWLLEKKQDLFGYFDQLVWSVNLGVPSPCVEDNPEQAFFRQAGQAAWMLSTLPETKITMNRIVAELEQAREPDYWDEDDPLACDFEIVPEIAAGAVGYALSDLRREGLHLMVDVGASTVDVCSFVLHAPEGSDRYSLLTADVQMVGAIRVHLERISALQRMIDLQAQKLRTGHDPSEPISENVESYLPCSKIMRAEMEEAEDRLQNECISMIRRVIWTTKRCRDPHASAWKAGRLPVLLIGGGCRLPFYATALKRLDKWLMKTVKNNGIQLLEAPVPASMNQQTNGYHRLAVAWGLSHRALDIGDITPADKIEDVEFIDSRFKVKEYIGKEHV